MTEHTNWTAEVAICPDCNGRGVGCDRCQNLGRVFSDELPIPHQQKIDELKRFAAEIQRRIAALEAHYPVSFTPGASYTTNDWFMIDSAPAAGTSEARRETVAREKREKAQKRSRDDVRKKRRELRKRGGKL